jgi:hypothetical protein
VVVDFGELVVELSRKPVELGVDLGSVRLVVDRVENAFTTGHSVFGVTDIRLAA